MTQERYLLVAAKGQEKLKEWLCAISVGEVVLAAGGAQARRRMNGDVFTVALDQRASGRMNPAWNSPSILRAIPWRRSCCSLSPRWPR